MSSRRLFQFVLRAILGLAFGQSCALAADLPPPWVVQVSSVYRSDSGEDVKMTGSGTVVQMEDRTFVLCDSHLSQGASGLTLLTTSGSPIPIKSDGRLADNDNDLEIIEITPEHPMPALQYDSTKKTFVATLKTEEMKSFFPVAGYDYVAPEVPWTNGEIHPWYPHARVKKTYKDDTVTVVNDTGPRVVAGGSEAVSSVGVRPGLSGAPLLAMKRLDSASSQVTLYGLCKGYHRFTDQSYFSTPEQISNMMTDYLSGARGKKTATEWRYGDFSYRAYGDGTLETVPSIIPTGNAIVMSAGNGSRGDGGNGSRGDGGTHVGQPAPKALQQGMIFEGKPVIGFHVKLPEAKVDDHVVEYDFAAEPAVLDWVKKMRKKGHVELTPVAANTPISQVIEKKLASASDSPKNSKGACYIDAGKLSQGELRIRLPYDSTNPNAKPVTLLVDVNHSSPFIEAGSSQKESLKVDMSGLSFGSIGDQNLPGYAAFEAGINDGGFFSDVNDPSADRVIMGFNEGAYLASLPAHRNPYITLQKEGGALQQFACYPSGWFTFWGSEEIDLRKKHAANEAENSAPCVPTDGASEVESLAQNTAPVLSAILNSERKPEWKNDPSIEIPELQQYRDKCLVSEQAVDGKSAMTFVIPDSKSVPHSFWLLLERNISSHLWPLAIVRHGCTEDGLWNQGTIVYQANYDRYGYHANLQIGGGPVDPAGSANVYCHAERGLNP